MKQLINVLVLLFLLTSFSFADIIKVPLDKATIQEALNLCSAGDTVLVSPGRYYENIVWPNTPGLCLISEQGQETTIIDGGGLGSVIKLISITDSLTIISGFTIRNGNSSYEGGGIYCRTSSPIIRDNLIDSNIAIYGGGISCILNSKPTIIGNIIRVNVGCAPAYGGGGGIYCGLESSGIIENNIIAYNRGYDGAALYIQCGSSTDIINNNISNNTATNSCGGICIFNNSFPLVLNNLIQYNYAPDGGGIGCYRESYPEIRGNTIIYNETSLSGGYGGGIGVFRESSSPHIVKNLIAYNKAAHGGGISCYEANYPIIDSNIIMNNIGDGIYSALSSNPIIKYNNIFGNSINSHFGIQNTDISLTINAKNNWWGDASGPYHPVTNPNGLGDAVSNSVDYTQYLLDSVVVGVKYFTQVIPDNFLLYQNYPNPFNPTTHIRFDVHKSSQIKLIIYNILGKEIKTLVNEKLSAGSYEVDWSASGNPSGVYFYKLVTEGFTNVKKMLLIK
ncbi:right-handed parallel beta-helix repeat-containing protein [Bacteroidota bacterium]